MARLILLRKHYIWGGLAILTIGVLGLLVVVMPLKLKQMQTKNWLPAKALLLDVQLTEEKKGSKYLYGVKAIYNFNLNGEPFEGAGVGLQRGLDDDKSFHEETYQRLSRLNTGANAIDILVNPKNARETIIDTNIRWWPLIKPIIGCSIIGLIGIFIALYGWMTPKTDIY